MNKDDGIPTSRYFYEDTEQPEVGSVIRYLIDHQFSRIASVSQTTKVGDLAETTTITLRHGGGK